MALTIEIFKSGQHTTADGKPVNFTESDIRQIARTYRPGLHEAPLVVGHPRDNSPAFGWTKTLHARGTSLLATVDQVDPSFSESVRSGRYKKVSASFYDKASPHNPTPGQYYLRHIGFLGAMPPSVKGLTPFQFAEGDDQGCFTVEFAEAAVGGDASASAAATADKVVSQAGSAVATAVTELVLKLATTGVVTALKAAFPDVDAAKLESTVTEAVTKALATPPEGETSGTALQVAVETALTGSVEAPVKEAVTAAGGEAAPASGGTLDHAEPNLTARERELKRRETELAATERRLRRTEYEGFLVGLGKAGKVLPIQRAHALDLMEQLASGSLNFSEGQPSALELTKKLMEAMPKSVEFGELSGGAVPADDAAALAAAASVYQAEQAKLGIQVSTTEAVHHVQGPR